MTTAVTLTEPRSPASHRPGDFIEVLHRRVAGDDAAELLAERLAAWDQLGRELAAHGWQHLEAALDRAAGPHAAAMFEGGPAEPGMERIGASEAERLAEEFAEDCRIVADGGGASTMWHALIVGEDISFRMLDAITVEKLQEGDHDECERLISACRCYALAAFATMDNGSDRRDARLLFGPDREADVDVFAPFASGLVRMDDREERWQEAAQGFATARTAQDRLEATDDYLLGMDGRAERCRLRAIERMGMIAWLARRAFEPAADDAMEQMVAALHNLSPDVRKRFAALLASVCGEARAA